MNYTKKPVTIQAVQWLTSNIAEVREFIDGEMRGLDLDSTTAYDAGMGAPMGSFVIKTLEGEMKVSHGDYIIKGVKGEFYPCKPDIFEVTYIKTPSDFIERIELEKSELDDKLEKLEAFTSSKKFLELNNTQSKLLWRQQNLMFSYSNLLGERIKDLKQ